ncbi:hypothetical protein BH23ACT4_BH23ACT4_05180 [soil metagenome]
MTGNDTRGWMRVAPVVIAALGLSAWATPLMAQLVSGVNLFDDVGGPWTIISPAFTVAGALIAISRPRHPIGWTFLWLGFGSSVSAALLLPVVLDFDLGISDGWISGTSAAINTFAVALLLPLSLHLFPDGSVLSPRWRWAAWLTVPVAIVGGVAGLFVGGWGGDPEQAFVLSSLYDDLGSLGETMSELFFPLLLVSLVIAGVSIVVRYRRSTGETRKQLQWLALAGGVLVAVVVIDSFLSGDTAASETVATVMFAASFALIPIAAAVAVLRYRLYDIDLVISRSLMVAALAGFITVIYVAVVGIGALVGSGDEPSLVLQIVATALVAVLFQPVRRRLRRWADRVVYGQRATPYEVLSAFSRRAAQTPDESSLVEIAQLVADGTGADPAVVWLRVGDRLHPAASFPSADGLEPILFNGTGHPPFPADLAVPVVHEGELLGALTVSKPRGEQVTPQDADLVNRLGSGVAVALRNVGLTAELRARLEDLHDSRKRLVTAQDIARQKLERDLHDGAQQELVALKVKLALTRNQAEKLGAEKTAELLSGLIADADQAVETLRDLARGIYPPLLEAEGLPVALEAQARKASLPVTVHSAGVGRYEPEVETAVYFCVLEALTNATRYADAKSVHIRLAETKEVLAFSIEDDGTGFDSGSSAAGSGLAGMADRLDTVRGRLEIDSEPGRGTSVRGAIPIRMVEEVTA